MIREDDDRPVKAPPTHRLGDILDTLSVEELADRIALLRAEIDRLEVAIASKRASRDAADSVFRR